MFRNLIASFFLLASLAAAAPKKIVIFGDSLSDNSNGIKQFWNSYFPLPPYYNFRFSNGPVWIEHFPTRDLLDFAYGGALVNQSGYQFGPPSLMAQINDFLISRHFDVHSDTNDTQYIFWGGGNDIQFSPISNTTLTDHGVTGQLAALEITLPFLVTWQVGKLMEAGATNILVMLLQPWSPTPLLQSYSPAQRQVLDTFTSSINKYIQGNVSAIPHEGVDLRFFDTFGLMGKVFENPEGYGLVNVTAPCLANWEVFIDGVGGETPEICADPDEYFFWDGYGHPTAKVHAVLGSEVMNFLNWQ